MMQPTGYYLRRVRDGELVVFAFCALSNCPRAGEVKEFNGNVCVIDLVGPLYGMREFCYGPLGPA